MRVTDLLRQAPDRVLSWKELSKHFTDRELSGAIGRGEIKRAGRGTYRLVTGRPQYAVAAELRGTLSHLSAAQHWRLATLSDVEQTHVTVDVGRSGVATRKDVQLYYRRLAPDDVDGRVTTMVRTVLDCARDLPGPEALAIGDSAVRDHEVDLDVLIHAASQRRGPRSGRVRRIVSAIDGRAVTPLESALRGVLVDAGLDGFRPQFPVDVGDDRRRHADLGHASSGVLLEADSYLAHIGRFALESDATRDAEFAAAGYVVLRFTWHHIMERREWLADMVRRTLAHRTTIMRTGSASPRPVGQGAR